MNKTSSSSSGLVGRCEDCQHYSDGSCYKVLEWVYVSCDCEGPIDGLRVDKEFCCKLYVPNNTSHSGVNP